MSVLRLRQVRPSADTAAVCGAAMREAREAAGLDLTEAAWRLNRALGSTIFSAGLCQVLESGRERPDAVVFIEYVRLAGEQAAWILASLA